MNPYDSDQMLSPGTPGVRQMKRSDLGHLLSTVRDKNAKLLSIILREHPHWAMHPWVSKGSVCRTAQSLAPWWTQARQRNDGSLSFRHLLELALLSADAPVHTVVLSHLRLTPSALNSALRLACETGHPLAVDQLLQKGASAHARSKAATTALLCATNRGHRDIVARLLTIETVVADASEVQLAASSALRLSHWACLDLLLPHVPRQQALAIHRHALKAGSGPLVFFEACMEREALERTVQRSPRRRESSAPSSSSLVLEPSFRARRL